MLILHIREEEARYTDSMSGKTINTFDHRWALAILEESLYRCEKHFKDSNREHHWKLFEQWVLQPAIMNVQPASLQETAKDVGFPTPARAASALQVVKKRVVALLREVTAETVDDESEVDEELAMVWECVSIHQDV